MIIVPVEHSVDSETLLLTVEIIARALAEEVILVHVLPDPYVMPTFPNEEVVLRERDRATSWLDGLADALRSRGVVARGAVRHGVVQAQVVDLANLTRARLVILLTHSRHGRRWLFSRDDGGEHAELMDHTSLPVLTLQKGAPALAALRTILVALDGSPSGDTILSDVSLLAVASGARVVLAHVLSTAASDSTRAMKVQLDARASELSGAGCMASSAVVTGTDVGRAIVQLAEEVSADIVAMAAQPRGQLGGLGLGRAVESVMRSTIRPLLLKNPAA